VEISTDAITVVVALVVQSTTVGVWAGRVHATLKFHNKRLDDIEKGE